MNIFRKILIKSIGLFTNIPQLIEKYYRLLCINHSIEPKTIKQSVLHYVPINNITLYVTGISFEDYKSALVWQDFGNIFAIGNH